MFRDQGASVLRSNYKNPKSDFESKYVLELSRQSLEDAVLIGELWSRSCMRAEFVDGLSDRDRYAEQFVAFLREYRMTEEVLSAGVEAIVVLARRDFPASNGDGFMLTIYSAKHFPEFEPPLDAVVGTMELSCRPGFIARLMSATLFSSEFLFVSACSYSRPK